jgi:hypothetical protein
MKTTTQVSDAKIWMQLVTIILSVILKVIFKKKFSKATIAKQYKISKPTLDNWIKNFYPEYYKQWRKIRKLSGAQHFKLMEILGYDEEMVLNKEQMCDIFATSNKHLRKIINEKGDTIGIPIEVWNSCSIYPPCKTQKIQELLDRS